ncbi:MAG: M20/M25/M40 family metallo-hydrolase [Actinomycetota bacterium]
MSAGTAADVVAFADAAHARARAELEALVRIPSVGAEAAHRSDVDASAEATAALLETHGLEHVRLLTVGDAPPFVVGDWLHAPAGAPTVLLYAHHDVQPSGPLEHWASDPFEPTERDGRLYGRGTADDKAGAVAHAHAVGAWLAATGGVPSNVRILIEGEEEVGSPHLHEFLAAHIDELRSDVLVLADCSNWAVGIPGLTYSLRGLTAADISVRALDGAQHSGLVGGIVPDPVMALAGILASLVDEHGDPAFAGATAGLRPATPREREPLPGLDDDPEALARTLGLRPGVRFAGDPTATVHERLWMRPVVTVIGFDAHPIRGSSNQILAAASARVSIRLGPGQDPEIVVDALREHVAERVPHGLEWEFVTHPGAPAWETDPTGPAFDAARRSLRAGFGVEPVLMGMGGSIPFVGPFADAFGGAPALLMGPEDPSSRIHGPDESLHLGDWASLIRAEVHLLAEIAAGSGA